MTTTRRTRLQARRVELLQRSDALRRRFATDAAFIAPPLAWIDRARVGWDWVRVHPEWPVGMLAVTAVLRPRKVAKWLMRAFGVWRMWQRLRPWVPVARDLLNSTR